MLWRADFPIPWPAMLLGDAPTGDIRAFLLYFRLRRGALGNRVLVTVVVVMGTFEIDGGVPG